MSDQDKATDSSIDLSSIPEPMRSMLLRQIDKMPASMREQLLREGSPMLDRLIAKARVRTSSGTAALSQSAAETKSVSTRTARVQTVRSVSGTAATSRVQTVRPGDSASHGPWLLVSAIALIGAIWYALLG
ncbi:MAG: hypothetical protein ABI365_09480 [Lysobacteraceae bacterium]